MPLYESVFIARQDISSGQVDTLADEMEKLILDNGGSVAPPRILGPAQPRLPDEEKPEGSLYHV